MLRLLRWLIGFCTHDYELLSITDVKYVGDEGPIQALDLAHRGAIKYQALRMRCTRCGKVTTKKVKP
jgi:hypothetical protein